MANATISRIEGDLDAQSPAADLVRVYLNGIGKTALLEFKLVRTPEEGKNVWSRADAYLAARAGAQAGLDSAVKQGNLMLRQFERANQ